MNTAYQELANAVVLQAAKDYRCALRYLAKHPTAKGLDDEERKRFWRARARRQEVERFFKSGWFSELTTISGEKLMVQLKEEVYGRDS